MPLRVLLAVLVLVTALAPSFDRDAAPGDDAAPPPPPPPPAVRVAPERPPIPIAVATTERVVALTFDDGPDPRWTPAVLDALAATGARATFFVTGERSRAHPDLLVRTVAEGHELANHTDTHSRLDVLSVDDVHDEVRRAGDAIGAAGVPQAGFFRPPKGRYGPDALSGVERTGLRTIGWTVCFERWLRRGAVLGVEETVARVDPGGIIVAHDGGIPSRAATIAALPSLLARLDADGYRVVTLTELLALGPVVSGRPGERHPTGGAAAGVQPVHGTAR